jgi:hypothetical protein
VLQVMSEVPLQLKREKAVSRTAAKTKQATRQQQQMAISNANNGNFTAPAGGPVRRI